MDKQLRFCRQPAFRGIDAGRLIAWHWQAFLSVALCDCKKCRKYLIPGNHKWRWIAFWFVQDMNTIFAQHGNTSGVGGMAHQVHLETRDSDNWWSSASERFA